MGDRQGLSHLRPTCLSLHKTPGVVAANNHVSPADLALLPSLAYPPGIAEAAHLHGMEIVAECSCRKPYLGSWHRDKAV